MKKPPCRIVVRQPPLHLLVDDMHILEPPLYRIALEYRRRTAQRVRDVHHIRSLSVGMRARQPHVYLARSSSAACTSRDRLPHRARSLSVRNARAECQIASASPTCRCVVDQSRSRGVAGSIFPGTLRFASSFAASSAARAAPIATVPNPGREQQRSRYPINCPHPRAVSRQQDHKSGASG